MEATTVSSGARSLTTRTGVALVRSRPSWGAGDIEGKEPIVTPQGTADGHRCLYAGCITVVRRRHFCDQHEALLKAQSAAVARRTEERRVGLTPEDGRAVSARSRVTGALIDRAVVRDDLLNDAIRRHGPVLSACLIPGCSTLTMGGTCVEHDPPASVTFPRGRPHVAVRARFARSRRDLRAGSTELCS